jgi:carbonic anhydrase
VLAEVDWLKRQEKVKKAMKDRGLQIHAFVFDRLTERCVRLVGAEKREEGERQMRI